MAITGARTFLGRELLLRLEADPGYDRVLALDVEPSELASDKVIYQHLDLTVPTAWRQVAQSLREHAIDTVVHGAYLSFPTHATAWAHELEDVGTHQILDACAAAKPERLIQVSTTMVYGARRDNPNFLREDEPLAADGAGFIADKVRADQQTQSFAERHPDIAVAQLRFAPILGPTIDGLFPRFFRTPAAPVMMGFDPLMQFVHERDALRALERVVSRKDPVRGIYNIVGRGVIPYTTVLAIMGKVPVPIPHRFARTLAKLVWSTQLARTPPVLLDFLRYLCVADGTKAVRELGLRAEYNQKQIALDFLGLGEDGSGVLAHAGVP